MALRLGYFPLIPLRALSIYLQEGPRAPTDTVSKIGAGYSAWPIEYELATRKEMHRLESRLHKIDKVGQIVLDQHETNTLCAVLFDKLERGPIGEYKSLYAKEFIALITAQNIMASARSEIILAQQIIAREVPVLLAGPSGSPTLVVDIQEWITQVNQADLRRIMEDGFCQNDVAEILHALELGGYPIQSLIANAMPGVEQSELVMTASDMQMIAVRLDDEVSDWEMECQRG